jgi:maltooligosyltrehalose synthase
VGPEVWRDTVLKLPGVEPGTRYQDVFTGKIVVVEPGEGGAAIAAGTLFAHFPVALLIET